MEKSITAAEAKASYVPYKTRNLKRILKNIARISETEQFYTKQGTVSAETVEALEKKGFTVTSIGTKKNPVVRVDWGWQEVKEVKEVKE